MIETCVIAIAAASEATGIPAADILSHTRVRQVVRARQIAMFIARKTSTLSYPVIGKQFRRDHTTVLHGVNLIDHLVAACPTFAAEVQTALQHAEDAMQEAKRKRRERRISNALTLPLRISTMQVCDLGGFCEHTLKKRIASGEMPASIDRTGAGFLYDRDAVLRALGLVEVRGTEPAVASW